MERVILSEKLEDQRKAVEWAKNEKLRLLKKKEDRIAKELMSKIRPLIVKKQNNN